MQCHFCNNQHENLRCERGSTVNLEAMFTTIETLQNQNKALHSANIDCISWYNAQQSDLIKCMKALSDISVLENNKEAQAVAKHTLDSLID